jgi:hypothetical protein
MERAKSNFSDFLYLHCSIRPEAAHLGDLLRLSLLLRLLKYRMALLIISHVLLNLGLGFVHLQLDVEISDSSSKLNNCFSTISDRGHFFGWT